MEKQYFGTPTLGGYADRQSGLPDYAQTAVAEARIPTPGERLMRAIERLHIAGNEVASLRERLCGSQPSNEANAKGFAGAPGFFGALDTSSYQIEAVVSSILEDVKTISSRL